MYAEAPVQARVDGSVLRFGQYRGALRAALVADDDAATVLDAHAARYPVGGCADATVVRTAAFGVLRTMDDGVTAAVVPPSQALGAADGSLRGHVLELKFMGSRGGATRARGRRATGPTPS